MAKKPGRTDWKKKRLLQHKECAAMQRRHAGASDKLPGAVFCDDTLDPLVGIQQVADGGIVVQGIDDIGDVFAHVAADVPLPLEKFRGLVDQVGGEDAVDDPLFIGLVKLVQAVGEEAESGKDEDVSRLSLL